MQNIKAFHWVPEFVFLVNAASSLSCYFFKYVVQLRNDVWITGFLFLLIYGLLDFWFVVAGF